MPPSLSHAVRTLALAAGLALLAGLGACVTTGPEPSPEIRALAARTGDLSAAGQRRLERAMDPAMLYLARRLEPGRPPSAG